MQRLRWPCTGIGLAVDNERPFSDSHLNRTAYLKEDDLVLVAAPIRPALYSEWLGDLPLWKTVDPKQKPVLLAHEWLALFEGPEPGPLSRQAESQWEALFDEVGYFHVHHHVKEVTPGEFVDKLTVMVGAVPPAPFPRLYRLSRPEWRHRWSWVTASDAAANLTRERGDLWMTDEPLNVFGRITELTSPIPGSNLMERTVFDEFIVRPGDVHPFTRPQPER